MSGYYVITNSNFDVVQNNLTLVFLFDNNLIKLIPITSISNGFIDYESEYIQLLYFYNEIKIQNYCYTIIPHICPEIYKYKIIDVDELKKNGIVPQVEDFKSFGLIIMEYIASIPYNLHPNPDFIKMRLLLELALIGITHGDFHRKNFIFTGMSGFKIIDFGESHIIDTDLQKNIEQHITEGRYTAALKLICYVERFNPFNYRKDPTRYARHSINQHVFHDRVPKKMYNWICDIDGDDGDNIDGQFINDYLSMNPPTKHRLKNVQYYSPIFKIKREDCYYPDDNLNTKFVKLIKRILLIAIIQGIMNIEFIVDSLIFDRDTLHISQVLSAMSDKSYKPLTFIYDEETRFTYEIPEIPNIEEDIRKNHEKIEELFTQLKHKALRKKIPILVKQFFELEENTIVLYNTKARLSNGSVNEDFRSNIESMLYIIYLEIRKTYKGDFNSILPFFKLVKIKPCINEPFNLSACQVLSYLIKTQRDKEWIDNIDDKNIFGNYMLDDPDAVEPHRHKLVVQFTDVPINYPQNTVEDITTFTKELLIENTRKYIPHFSRLFRRPNGTRLRLNNGDGIFRKYGGTRKKCKSKSRNKRKILVQK